ncbi:MAG: hypothetical protein AAFN92_13075, partial [Bacteroidota bacterium]
MDDKEREELNRQLRLGVEEYNSAPLDDFLGLSPKQIHHLNRDPLGAGSAVRWQANIAPATLAQVPLLTLAVDLLSRLEEKEIKLTAIGNLPGKLVKEWYAKGLIPQDDLESGTTKLSSEDDYFAATTLKYCLSGLGWTKKRKGKLSLTAKGNKALMGQRQKLLEQLFLEHFTHFNLGFFDGYEDQGYLQRSFGIVLVQLLKNGKVWERVEEYGNGMLQAFPMLMDTFEPSDYQPPDRQVKRAYALRFFRRSLNFYGLV